MADFETSKPVGEVLRRAFERIDGKAMYGLGVLYFLAFLIYALDFEKYLPFEVNGPNYSGVFLGLIPIWFIYYISFGVYSESDSRGYQVFNAASLVVIGVGALYLLMR